MASKLSLPREQLRTTGKQAASWASPPLLTLSSVFTRDEQRVVVDEVSWEYLQGATVDFRDEMIAQTFTISNNPGATGSCGCGVSFEPKAFT